MSEVTLSGITASHAFIGREKVAEGRYISDQDYHHNTLSLIHILYSIRTGRRTGNGKPRLSGA